MSEEMNQASPDSKPTAEENTVPAKEPVIEAPKVNRARWNEVHTPLNTSMQDIQDPVTAILRPLTEREISDGYLTVFLGNTKSSREKTNDLIRPYMQLLIVRDLHRNRKTTDDVLRKAENEWVLFVETNYPNNSLEEITDKAGSAVQFYTEILDELRCRSNSIRESGISNVSDRGGLVTSDIFGRKPGNNTANMKPSDIMKRKVTRSENGRLAFDIELRNSFVKTVISRPSKSEIGILIDDIKDAVKGYVRKVNNNTAVIARIAIGRVIWKFFIKQLTYSSVNDIADYNQLASIIRWSDIDAITVGILRAYTKEGVNMHLVCANPTCDWHDMSLIDPEKILHCRHSHTTPEEAAIYANLFNDKVTYSTAETLALIKEAKYGLDDKKTYNEDKSLYMELDSPSMADAFQTLDFFLERVNPLVQSLRERTIDPDAYDEKREMLFVELGATEYIHWVSTFVAVAEAGSGEPDVVLARDVVEDQNDFNDGVMSIVKDSSFLRDSLTRAILRKTPFLSKTFVGLSNYECPKCKEMQDTFEDPEGLKDRKLGYTPIDPIMSFFILIQLLQVKSAVENSEAAEKALSELEN